MKKTILIALMAIVATSTVVAQEVSEKKERHNRDGEKRIERQMKRLDKKLALTDEQKAQIKDYYTEFDNLKKARMEQMRQQEEADRKALDGKIQSILTPEQQSKYAEMKEKEKEMKTDGKRDGMRGRGHGPRQGGMRGMGGHRGHGGFGGAMMDGDMEK